ncbi:MAG TPA: ISNCY family transposase [Pirellulales bacterium]|nr:ISNCY family transposase [Pirellulales bacterium]
METIRMSGKERRRLEVLSRVKSQELSLVKGAELLGMSYRQAKRVWARYQEEGDTGLVHRLRGRASNRHVQPIRKEQALELYREKYAGYGPTLAAECLERDDGLSVPASTLREWLSAAGLWQRQRRRKLHRRRRPRREHYGELLQMDGSHHDWFEGRRGTAVLMVMIDDATGRIFAWFFENESWDSAATILRGYTARHGLPRALYVDRHSIYRADWEPTPDEILAGIEPTTQFGRAMRDLDVELIRAHSPQAKGRVERVNRTLQDRLVKDLTRAGISDLESANRYLEETYHLRFNQQFGRSAAKQADMHRVVTDERLLLMLSLQEDRVVQPDWTVRWQNGFLQLPRAAAEHVQPGQRVVISSQLDGRLRIFVGDQELAWSTVRDPLASPGPASPTGPTGSSQGQKPAANHPWRRRFAPPRMAAAVGLDCSAPVAALPALRSPTPQRE